MDDLLYVIVSARKPGAKRKTKKEEVKTEADRGWVSAQKLLFNSKEYRDICNLDARVKSELLRICLPAPHLKEGVYTLRTDQIDEVTKLLDEYVERHGKLVEVFIAAYPQRIDEARTFLGPLWKKADYPSPQAMRCAFSASYRFLEFGVPKVLSSVNAAAWKQAKEAAARAMEEAKNVWKDLLRKQMEDLAGDLCERVADPERTFKNSTIERVEDFLARFEQRNVADDGELAKVVKQARDALIGVTPQGIRDDKALRQQVVKAFDGIRGNLETERRKRAIVFSDEEV